MTPVLLELIAEQRLNNMFNEFNITLINYK